MQNRGLFIEESEIPAEYWRGFFHLAQSQGMTIKELMVKMVIREVNEVKNMQKPILEQVVHHLGTYINGRRIAGR